MPYTPVTPAQFRAAKPQFEDMTDQEIQAYLDLAELYVDESWPERFYQPAIIAVACHLATLDGMGTDPQSESFSSGASGYQTIKSGDLTLTRFKSDAQSAGLSTTSWFAQTSCGAQYLVWMRMFKGGPVVALGGPLDCVSTYAKDLYRDSWWP